MKIIFRPRPFSLSRSPARSESFRLMLKLVTFPRSMRSPHFLLPRLSAIASDFQRARLSDLSPLSSLTRASENENENNEATSVILLIQSMKNFSLLRTTDGDCYRVVCEIGRWMWSKKINLRKKICQDLPENLKKCKTQKEIGKNFFSFILRHKLCDTGFFGFSYDLECWKLATAKQKAFIFVRQEKTRKICVRLERRKFSEQ